MGLGELFMRNINYVATDTNTGATETYTVVTDGGPGMYAAWSAGQYDGGMALPGAWRCALLLADLVGGMPWHAYTGPEDAPVRVTPTPLVLAQPAPPDVRITTFSSWMLDLAWHGNAIGIVAARDDTGQPTAYLPVSARNVAVDRVGPGTPDVALPIGTIVYRIGRAVYAADDVLHIKGPCEPGALRGMGIIEHHLRGVLGLAAEQNRQAAALATSGVPTGVLKSSDPDLDEDAAADLKVGWLASQRDRTVAVLNTTTDFEPLAWDPTETQLLEARKYSLHETALIFGLDPSWLGVSTDSMTYQNIETKAIDLVRFSAGGHLARFEQTLSAELPAGMWTEANRDSVLRADTLTRYQAHEIALRNRWMTDDEVRALENLPPLTAAQRTALAPPEPVPTAPAEVPA